MTKREAPDPTAKQLSGCLAYLLVMVGCGLLAAYGPGDFFGLVRALAAVVAMTLFVSSGMAMAEIFNIVPESLRLKQEWHQNMRDERERIAELYQIGGSEAVGAYSRAVSPRKQSPHP